MFYKKVVINMKTLEEVEVWPIVVDESRIAFCKGGGGGSSGKVSYPAYLETFHSQVLDDAAADTLDSSLAEQVNLALVSNPYTGVVAYNPSARLTDAWTVVDAYETLVDALADVTDWAAMFTQAVTSVNANFGEPVLDADIDIAGAWLDPSPNAASDIASGWIDPAPDAPADIATAWIDPSPDAPADIATAWVDPAGDAWTDIDGDWDESQPGSTAEIEADVDAYEDIVDDHVTTDVLPRFQRGMQDVNAVMSSAFTIGQAIIEGMADRDIAKYHGTLRVAAFTQKDQIEAANVLEKNKGKAAAYIEDDRLNATSKQGESDALSRANMQDDQINAESKRGESGALSQANMQDDQINAESKRGESRALADAYIQDDKINADSKRGESDALAIAHVQVDRLNTIVNDTKNRMFVQSVGQMVSYFTTRIQANADLARIVVDTDRISIMAEKEEEDIQTALDASEALWGMESFQYVGNLIAGISGGTAVPNIDKPTKMQSALGGAMAGAAVGAHSANPYGIAIGAGIGAVAGYMAA